MTILGFPADKFVAVVVAVLVLATLIGFAIGRALANRKLPFTHKCANHGDGCRNLVRRPDETCDECTQNEMRNW